MRKSIVGAVTLAAATGLASLGVAAIGESAHGVGGVCVSYSGVNYAQFGSAACLGRGTAVAVGDSASANSRISGIGTAVGSLSGTISDGGGIATQAGTNHRSIASPGSSATGANCTIAAPPGSTAACPPPVLVP